MTAWFTVWFGSAVLFWPVSILCRALCKWTNPFKK